MPEQFPSDAAFHISKTTPFSPLPAVKDKPKDDSPDPSDSSAEKAIASQVEKWTTIDEDLRYFVIGNSSHMSEGFHTTPSAHISDGMLEVIFVHGISRIDMLGYFGKMENGTMDRSCKGVSIYKCHEVIIEPKARSLVDIDGERAPNVPTHIAVMRGAATVCAG